ncbi:aldo/keto reductase [Kangsaoukella pontilimi]|nr:aldo/keto reductase [Kangsaoukella pontilimi]
MLTTISGAPVSRFSFGTMQFGDKADETASAAMYSACREAGINFFDTAYGYTEGRSETITGNLVRAERDDVFVATKTGGSNDASPATIHAQFAESRRRLGLETVDLLYVHQIDPVTPLEETLGAFREYVESGTVRYVGLSNHAAWQIMKARGIAREMGFDIAVLQPMFNLVKRQAEVEILPMAASEGFAVCPYSPLGGGLLTGKYAEAGGGRLLDDPRYKARYAVDWMHQTAADLLALGRELNVDPATLAVAWVAHQKGVWGPIISARSVEQLRPSLAAIGFDMDDDLSGRISALSQKPAPANDRLEES